MIFDFSCFVFSCYENIDSWINEVWEGGADQEECKTIVNGELGELIIAESPGHEGTTNDLILQHHLLQDLLGCNVYCVDIVWSQQCHTVDVILTSKVIKYSGIT